MCLWDTVCAPRVSAALLELILVAPFFFFQSVPHLYDGAAVFPLILEVAFSLLPLYPLYRTHWHALLNIVHVGTGPGHSLDPHSMTVPFLLFSALQKVSDILLSSSSLPWLPVSSRRYHTDLCLQELLPMCSHLLK